MIDSKQIGLQLKALRLAANLTQKELAVLLDSTEFSVSKVEHGKWNITVDLLEKYCKALGVSMEITFKINKKN